MNGTSYRDFVRAYAKKLRAADAPPGNRGAWEQRAIGLRARILDAIGVRPEPPCPLQPQVLGELKRPGYVIERLTFQTRPDVWATANLYRPEPAPKKGPAVLVVHGHWKLARVDPVVQSRCLGLVQLGFTVLAIDAFGSGERYSFPAPGSYHGAFYGGTLWPTGRTLLGIQLDDNRRAVDYLVSRPEVDPDRIGITGASGGGNQSMYAGAFDDRLKAVVPVCSVGNYQANLLVACCVCEVVPNALTFTEEGDVLGLIAPRALLIINAAKDTVQFSPAEAEMSVTRAQHIYNLFGAGDRIKHAIFDAGHGYDKAMREAMYGWMTRWLKKEGDGEPIPEPQIALEDPANLRCYPDPDQRPKIWLFPPTLAFREGTALIAKQFNRIPTHTEEWESTAVFVKTELRRLLGEFPPLPRTAGVLGPVELKGNVKASTVTLTPEPGMPLVVTMHSPTVTKPQPPACVLLHMDGAAAALKQPLALALLKAGWNLFAPDLRQTKDLPPAGRLPGDHHAAEQGIWIGRPLLGQWVFEVQALIDWISVQPINRRRLYLAGYGSAGLIALMAAALDSDRLAGAVLVGSPASYLSDAAYLEVWRMGAIVPGILRAGDVTHLAAVVAPRRLVIADGVDPQAARLAPSKLRMAFGYAGDVYKLYHAADKLTVVTEPVWDDIAARLV